MTDEIIRKAYRKKNGVGRPKGTTNGNGKKNKSGGGRPCEYDPKLHPLLVTYMKREGLTEDQICKELHLSVPTLKRWRKDFPEFDKAMLFNRIAEMEGVVRSLYSLTKGWEYIETKKVKEKVIVDRMLVGKDGRNRDLWQPVYGDDWQEVKIETTTKRVLPNVAAIQFYLSNKAFQPGGGYGINWGTGWRRSDPPPAKPGESDDMKNPEDVAMAFIKVSRQMEAVV